METKKEMKLNLKEIEEKAKEINESSPEHHRIIVLRTEVVLKMISIIRKQQEGLEWYAERKHLKLNEDANHTTISFDPKITEWKIGPPYLIGAEYGQKARQTLTEVSEVMG